MEEKTGNAYKKKPQNEKVILIDDEEIIMIDNN